MGGSKNVSEELSTSFEKELLKSLQTGFISSAVSSNSVYAPALLTNNRVHKKKILTSLVQELETCEEFLFSVAFISSSGLASILETLVYLNKHNIKGRILTTNYLNFTEPAALSKILEFSNIELRAYTNEGFHPKGYIFRQSNYYSMIIGSANLTQTALSQNQEWSVRFLSTTDGQMVYSVREEFERVWNEAEIVDEDWIRKYQHTYKNTRLAIQKHSEENIESNSRDAETDFDIVPNSMQKEAMASLAELRSKGQKRALLIAATGTGKTYLSIFDVIQQKAKRVLYVAHRDMILRKSATSFDCLIKNIDIGFLNGTQKDWSACYLFASVFTLAKDDVIQRFSPNDFDYIIIDEVHHAGAASYKKIIDYFTPQFLLGLTATPERTDGFDIFSQFDNNIAFEIRLQKALEENLLCPFHYYGVSDLTVDGEVIDDKTSFTKLVSDERISHIEKAIKLYKNNGESVRGLIFCSRVNEAREISGKLNERGFVTKFLDGTNSDIERESVISELENDENPLQYIVSVDIFNEGVDIPSLNQVVMLRPTQSAIIFVQQLGRGLRKAKNKSYVSVIDFIGNYENNFYIPIALYGDNSYNKDNLRRYLSAGSSMISGCSTIQINQIAREKIFDAINKMPVRQLKVLKTEYEKLKMRLAHTPTMMDFVFNGFIDPLLFIDYAGSYFEFKCKIKETELNTLDDASRKSLQFISQEFAHGIRVHELLLLKILMEQKEISLQEFGYALKNYNAVCTQKDVQGMCRLLANEFYTQSDQRKYGNISYVSFNREQNKFSRTDVFEKLLLSPNYCAELNDCICYGIKRVTLKDEEKFFDNNLVLYRKYSRKDVCKLLNWKSDYSSTIYGYKTYTNDNNYTCPIFVTYKKSDDISDSTNYDDRFIDNTRFNWMSRNNRTSESEEVKAIIDQATNNIKVMLFVKKDDAEGSDFYYLGDMKCAQYEDTFIKTEQGNRSIVNIQFDMVTPVKQELYDYLEY